MSEADEENETIEGAMAVYMAIATQVLPVQCTLMCPLSVLPGRE